MVQPKDILLKLLFALLSPLVFLAGCTDVTPTDQRLTPTVALVQVPTLPATTAPPMGSAQQTALTVRHIPIPGTAQRQPSEAVVARLDPDQVRLQVRYNPDSPRLVSEWSRKSNPLLVVNGGFFTAEWRSTALVVVDGVASGETYVGFGGMISVDTAGQLDIRSLRDHPYDPSESLSTAIQSFPMLVFPGNQVPALNDNGQRARRTAVAIDEAGFLMVIVVPNSSLTLQEFAEWLSTSDLHIDRALNLDGGPSTGMYVQADGVQEQIDSFDRVPIVLVAERE